MAVGISLASPPHRATNATASAALASQARSIRLVTAVAVAAEAEDRGWGTAVPRPSEQEAARPAVVPAAAGGSPLAGGAPQRWPRDASPSRRRRRSPISCAA